MDANRSYQMEKHCKLPLIRHFGHSFPKASHQRGLIRNETILISLATVPFFLKCFQSLTVTKVTSYVKKRVPVIFNHSEEKNVGFKLKKEFLQLRTVIAFKVFFSI